MSYNEHHDYLPYIDPPTKWQRRWDKLCEFTGMVLAAVLVFCCIYVIIFMFAFGCMAAGGAPEVCGL